MNAILILLGAFAGSLFTFIFKKIFNRRSRLVVERINEEFKHGENLPIGANLKVLYGDREIQNFLITKFKITNESSKDFQDMKIRVWSGPDRFILHDQIHIPNYLEPVYYHPEFVQNLQPDQNGNFSAIQISKYNTEREYQIRFFNRFDSVEIVLISYVERPTNSNVWLEIPETGIKLINKYNRQLFWGIPSDALFPYTITFILLSIILPIFLFQSSWASAIFAGVGTSISTVFAALTHKFVWKIKTSIFN